MRQAGVTWLSYEQFCLGVEVATAHDRPLPLLLLVVQHVVHLVVDHVVAELLAFGALVLLTSSAMAERRGQATDLAATIVRLASRVCTSLVRAQDGLGAWLYKAAIALSAWA